MKLLHQAADGLSAPAAVQLGRCHELGIGVQADADKAFDWYWAAARMENAEACYRLGLMLLEGRGCKPNTQKATKWFRKAAEKKHAKAQQKLDELSNKQQ